MLHGWFWPVCASSPAVVSSGEEVEHSWVEGALEFSSGGRQLMPWSSGREFTLAAGVVADSYKKVKSGGVPDVTPPMIKSFYSGRYKSFVPEVFNAFVAYHAIIRLHIVRGTGSVVCILLTAVVAG
ncbi:hypothetical protein BHM03_00053529 [Ensete ventricosum]|nr:hypothetical protein BHM03_00053529 [Ensete ventricosum]